MEICFTSDKLFISVKITSLVLVRISDDGGDVVFCPCECVVRIVVSYDMVVFSLMMVIMVMGSSDDDNGGSVGRCSHVMTIMF